MLAGLGSSLGTLPEVAPFSGALAAPPAGRPAAPAANRADVTLLPASRAVFRARDPVETIDGHIPIASARLALDPARLGSARGSLTVRTAAISTGNVLRDQNARRALLDSARYPTASFTLTRVEADPSQLRDGASSRLRVTGELRLHGVTRKVVATGTVARHGARLTARLDFALRLTDFGMVRPRLLFIQVDDRVSVQAILELQLQPTAAAGTTNAATAR